MGFAAFSEVFRTLATRGAAELGACEPEVCAWEDVPGRFRCGARFFYADAFHCDATGRGPLEQCRLIGGAGARGRIACGGKLFACCLEESCTESLPAGALA